MKSSDKLEVTICRVAAFGDKPSVKVRHKSGSSQWIPSFEDLFRIIQAICNCEDKKYPNGKGRNMVRDFLWDACIPDGDWETLRQQYQIPVRH